MITYVSIILSAPEDQVQHGRLRRSVRGGDRPQLWQDRVEGGGRQGPQ